MNLRDFRVSWRRVRGELGYSLTAIVGLSVGIAVCVLLLSFVRFCHRYDAHVPDVDRIYIVKVRYNNEADLRWTEEAPLVLRNIAKTIPGVADVSGYVTWFPLTAMVEGKLHKLPNLTVLPDFEALTGLRALRGNLHEALTNPDAFAITEQGALRLFGTTDVLGRSVTLSTVHEGTVVVRIAAILPNPPANTMMPFEALNGLNIGLVPDDFRVLALTGREVDWSGGALLLKLHPQISPASVAKTLQQDLNKLPNWQLAARQTPTLGKRNYLDVGLSPFRDAYFDVNLATNRYSLSTPRGSPMVTAGLAGIAILILLLATSNYVNLMAILVMRRQREIAMRKVLGAEVRGLALQLLTESVFAASFAAVLGLVLGSVALPVLSQMTSRNLAGLLSPAVIFVTLASSVLLGLLTAAYPAWVAMQVRPAQVLIGRAQTESLAAKRLRRSLSTLQVGAALGLGSVALAIYFQAMFAMRVSPGFDPKHLLVVDLPLAQEVGSSDKSRGFMTALLQRPSVAAIAVSNDAIGRSRRSVSTQMKREGGTSITLDIRLVSANYFDVYGLRLVAGRLFSATRDHEEDRLPVVLDALAARELGFASPAAAVGQTVLGNLGTDWIAKRVVGIAPPVHFYSLRQPSQATAYILSLDATALTLRARGSTADAERDARQLWPSYFPHSIPEIAPASAVYAANYEDDARFAQLLGVAGAVALVIGLCGVYVVASDVLQRRRKEIALRKVLGAGHSEIVGLIVKDLGSVLLIAAGIGLPLAVLAIINWLADYTERSPAVTWAPVLASGAVALAMVLAAARHTWLATAIQPAAALKHDG